jgi:hypothetical protein
MARDRGSLTSPYELLADLAAAELELVRSGSFEAVRLLQEERRVLVSRLPSSPPPEARAPLTRAAALQDDVSVALAGALELARLELARLGRGRGAVQGYTPCVAWAGSVDLAG